MRRLTRRSFLARVAGGAAIAGAGAAGLAGRAGAFSRLPPLHHPCSDADEGAQADVPLAWYTDRDIGAKADPIRPNEGYTDSDQGPNSDRDPQERAWRCSSDKPRPPRRESR